MSFLLDGCDVSAPSVVIHRDGGDEYGAHHENDDPPGYDFDLGLLLHMGPSPVRIIRL